MNLFINGILLSKEAKQGHTLEQKINIIKQTLNQIMADTNPDKEDLVLVALPEYAISMAALSKDEKNIYMKAMQECADNYPNLIFIPGSISYYSVYTPDADAYGEKKKKLMDKYQAVDKYYLASTKEITKEKQAMDQAMAENKPVTVLHNLTWLISQTQEAKTQKRHKSFPFYERQQLGLAAKNLPASNVVFSVGSEDPVKQLKLPNAAELKVAVVICREYNNEPTNTNEALKDEEPAIEVVIGDGINPNFCPLYGDVNVIMDNKFPCLEVYQNASKVSQFNHVSAKMYTIDSHYMQRKLSVSSEDIDVVQRADLTQDASSERRPSR